MRLSRTYCFEIHIRTTEFHLYIDGNPFFFFGRWVGIITSPLSITQINQTVKIVRMEFSLKIHEANRVSVKGSIIRLI